MFRAQGQDAVVLKHNIDSPFITQLEQRYQNVQFQRIDADVTDNAKEEVAEDEKEAFQKTVDESDCNYSAKSLVMTSWM